MRKTTHIVPARIRGLLHSRYAACVRHLWGSGVGRFTLVRFVHNSIMRLITPQWVRVNGQWINTGRFDSIMLSIKDPFYSERCWLDQQLSPGDAVLDIGANVGYFTASFAHRVGPEGKVFAFEPEPENYALLCSTIERNGHGNVCTVQSAVGERSSKVYLERDGLSAETPFVTSSPTEDAVRVTQTSIDDFFDVLPQRLSLVKIDVEGRELHVLRGMKRLLATCPRVRLFIEFAPKLLKRAGTDPRVLFGFLADNHFSIFEFVADCGTVFKVQIEDLLKRYPHNSDGYTNLWCRKAPT
ncbi:MAG: hypothetical protein FLDDKLPJ_03327 [Phycisphaerae bacterium]|nr:hypothetical protein [Phycisphaerae bacterium]